MQWAAVFGHFFFICPLIDEMRQVLWVMAFIKLTWMHSAAEPLVVRLPPRKKKSFSFPTSSARLQWAWHLAMQKPPCIIQKFGPAQMSKGETSICRYETAQGTERACLFLPLFFQSASRYLAANLSAELPTRNITKMLTLLHKGA